MTDMSSSKKSLVLCLLPFLCGAGQAAVSTPVDKPQYQQSRFGTDIQPLSPQEVSPSLQKAMTPNEQILKRFKGAATPEASLNANGVSRHGSGGGLQFFPSQPLNFMPYLDSLYVLGNTCVEPGAVFEEDALSTSMQKIKKEVSQYGVTYSLSHGFGYSYVAGELPDRSNKRSFPVYNLSLQTNVTFFRDSHTGNGLFLISDLEYGPGLGFNQNRQAPNNSMGASQLVSGFYNFGDPYFENLSLGYTAFKGKLVVMAGLLEVDSFLDHNIYAASFDNSSLNNTQALPLSSSSWGYHIAWQPNKSFYMMISSTSNNTPVRHNPFNYISSNNWSNVLEIGWITEDLAGLGPGAYRIQPFWTTSQGDNGGGLAINIQQQLGRNSTLGWFLTAGAADDNAARVTGIQYSAATGLLWMTPFSKTSSWRIFRSANNGCLGLGVLWQRGAKDNGPYTNNNEYGAELSYTLQMTPTMTIKPDIQVVHNPIHGKRGQTDVVLQIQNIWTW